MKLASLVFLLVLGVLAFLMPWISPQGEWLTDMQQVFAEPSLGHIFGFDQLGRDLLIRSLYGARVSLMIGISCTFVAAVLGFFIGSLSGFIGGRLDQMIMRALEILLALPSLIWMAILILILQKNISTDLALIIAISSSTWMLMAKHVRSLILREKYLPYVEAEVAVGATPTRILFRHIFPNINREFLVYIGSQLPSFILYESLMSFIGIGLQPPTASWGLLIQDGWKTLTQYPHLTLMPSLLLFFTVFSINILLSQKT